jgi:hypothetical protein
VRPVLAGLAALAAGAVMAGCASAPAPRDGAAHPSTSTTRRATPTLAAEPFPDAAGVGDPLVLSASGTGPRVLPAFVAHGSSLYFEIACLGAGTFTVVDRKPLFRVGPCNGDGTTSIIGGENGRRLALVVDVPAVTRWELYVTES